jgi:hypothetical protein
MRRSGESAVLRPQRHDAHDEQQRRHQVEKHSVSHVTLRPGLSEISLFVSNVEGRHFIVSPEQSE